MSDSELASEVEQTAEELDEVLQKAEDQPQFDHSLVRALLDAKRSLDAAAELLGDD